MKTIKTEDISPNTTARQFFSTLDLSREEVVLEEVYRGSSSRPGSQPNHAGFGKPEDQKRRLHGAMEIAGRTASAQIRKVPALGSPNGS